MSLKSGFSVAIMSAVFVSQMILHTEAQTGAARTPQDITFDCDPEQLHGAARLTCLARRFEEGRRLFDEETFQGNGRTCVTCHSVRTGTFSPEDAQKRLAANPGDPLFVGDGLDDGVHGTSRITGHATVRIEIPLPPRFRLANDPSATSVTFLRGTRRPAIRRRSSRFHVRRPRYHARSPSARCGSRARPERCRADAAPARAHRGVPANVAALLFVAAAVPLRSRRAAASAAEWRHRLAEARASDVRQRAHHAGLHQGALRHVSQRADARRVQRVQYLPADLPGLRFFGVGVSERNKLNLPTHKFIIDGIDRIVTPDPGACLTDPRDPDEFPPELFGPGGPLPLIIACNLFKTPSLWGIRHTAPYFHDNSSKTLEEVAEQYTFMFEGSRHHPHTTG